MGREGKRASCNCRARCQKDGAIGWSAGPLVRAAGGGPDGAVVRGDDDGGGPGDGVGAGVGDGVADGGGVGDGGGLTAGPSSRSGDDGGTRSRDGESSVGAGGGMLNWFCTVSDGGAAPVGGALGGCANGFGRGAGAGLGGAALGVWTRGLNWSSTVGGGEEGR